MQSARRFENEERNERLTLRIAIVVYKILQSIVCHVELSEIPSRLAKVDAVGKMSEVRASPAEASAADGADSFWPRPVLRLGLSQVWTGR